MLIDEIDKADIDFPNDLLHELDQLAFDIPEVPGLGYAVPEDKPELRPVVIVTNNEEKTLPAAFLRRCVFHYIEFPKDPDDIAAILALHGIDNDVLREEAVDVLLDLRKLDLSKKPGLSELLDWAGYLHAVKMPVEELASLPYLGALIKQRSDECESGSSWRQDERPRPAPRISDAGCRATASPAGPGRDRRRARAAAGATRGLRVVITRRATRTVRALVGEVAG